MCTIIAIDVTCSSFCDAQMHTSHVNPIKLNMGLSKNNLLSRRNILRINICFHHDFLTYRVINNSWVFMDASESH